jgi:hypothetical protein
MAVEKAYDSREEGISESTAEEYPSKPYRQFLEWSSAASRDMGVNLLVFTSAVS